MKYDSPAYAGSRLNGTAVRVKDSNKLVLVEEVFSKGGEDNRLYCSLLSISKNGEFRDKLVLPIEDLELTTPTLGYIQKLEHSVWVCRVPMRQDYRQGIRTNNLRLFTYREASGVNNINRSFQMNNFNLMSEIGGATRLSLGDLIQPLANSYHPLPEVIEMVEDAFFTVPFSRDFAVSRYMEVYYCGNTVVGSVNDMNGEIRLSDEYFFLQEQVDEVTGVSAPLSSTTEKPEIRGVIHAS